MVLGVRIVISEIFLLFWNQTKIQLALNLKENFEYNHIPFSLTINRNPFRRV